jgi:HlyD family secretion protein
MKRVRLVLLLVVVVAIAGGVYVWQTRPAGPTVWQGYAEGDDVFVGPTLAGLLVHVDVARGQMVKEGAPLFEQDATGDGAAVRQAQANLDTARATLANLVQPGGRPEQIAQAAADLADKTAVRKRIEVDLARDVRLLPSSAVSQQQVDTERQALASAVAQEAGSAANLAWRHRPLALLSMSSRTPVRR